jgi:excisionase family DNA binding protein
MKIFTTTKVAKILQVSNRKVTQWIDDGVLEGYPLPGSTHRRVSDEKLRDFMEQNNFPLKLLDDFLANEAVIKTKDTVIELQPAAE